MDYWVKESKGRIGKLCILEQTPNRPLQLSYCSFRKPIKENLTNDTLFRASTLLSVAGTGNSCKFSDLNNYLRRTLSSIFQSL